MAKEMLGKIVVHGCDIPGFNKKIEIFHMAATCRDSIKGAETFEAWYEDGSLIVIQCKHNTLDPITIRGGVVTNVQCVYDKQIGGIRAVITREDNPELYDELLVSEFVEDDTPEVVPEVTEHRMQCKVCGHIYCYTDEDVRKNDSNSLLSAISAVGSLASTLGGGTRLDSYAQQRNADRYSDKVIDFSRCPRCNSTHVEPFTGNDNTHRTVTQTAAISSADEIKKFKELLDLGIITQEEFDAKKKQLLGL